MLRGSNRKTHLSGQLKCTSEGRSVVSNQIQNVFVHSVRTFCFKDAAVGENGSAGKKDVDCFAKEKGGFNVELKLQREVE